MSVITFPKQGKIPMQPDLPVAWGIGVNLPAGTQLAGNASAQLVVMDRLGRKRIGTYEGTRNATSFEGSIPVEDANSLPHGTKYRIYVDNGTIETRFIAEFGVLIWVGK